MEQVKILWIGDAVASTGFARVNHGIIKNLSDKYKVFHLGVNYRGDPHPYDHAIYPASTGGDLYGMNRLPEMIDGIKPDIIFILNDAWLVADYIRTIKETKFTGKIVVYTPVDAEEHSPSFYGPFTNVDVLCTYTNFGKMVIEEACKDILGVPEARVIPHAVDTSVFYPINKKEAKRILYNGKFLDNFVILNANRNQPRKRLDLTLLAFKEFHKNKSDVRLYMHCGIVDSHINIVELASRYNFRDKLILSRLGSGIPSVPEDRLNVIYNATDIGINTSMGEGWGLTNFEHAATYTPQILMANSCIPELWQNKAILVPSSIPFVFNNINTVGRIATVEDIVTAMEFAYNDWKSGGSGLSIIAKEAYEMTQRPEYSWKHVAKEFEKIFEEVL